MEFGIAEPAVLKDGKWHLVGRCVTDIRIGARFTKYIPHHAAPNDGGGKTYYEGAPLDIDLVLLEIHRYGRLFQEWGAGHTALLVLEGDGRNLKSFGSIATDELAPHYPGRETGRFES